MCSRPCRAGSLLKIASSRRRLLPLVLMLNCGYSGRMTSLFTPSRFTCVANAAHRQGDDEAGV